MPRREQRAPATLKATTAGSDLRPGDDYNQRMSWAAVLEPAGWTEVFTRGDVTHWRRPDKTFGISATTNFGGSDLFYPFTSSTEFQPETTYSRFGVYALLEHRGDFGKAALALAKKGYGEQDDTPVPVAAQTEPVAPRTLDETIATFRRWLYLEDPSSVYAVAATLVANRAPGDPVWLLLVCAPSTRDFRFACPRWPLYTPEGSRALETLVRHSIVPLQRPSAQLGRLCHPLTSLRSGRSADTAPDVCPFFARRAALRVPRQSAGTGSAQIRRSMSPNSRRVRCPSASRSQ